jgi:hypothetical protein
MNSPSAKRCTSPKGLPLLLCSRSIHNLGLASQFVLPSPTRCTANPILRRRAVNPKLLRVRFDSDVHLFRTERLRVLQRSMSCRAASSFGYVSTVPPYGPITLKAPPAGSMRYSLLMALVGRHYTPTKLSHKKTSRPSEDDRAIVLAQVQ